MAAFGGQLEHFHNVIRAVLITELSFLVGARLFFLVEERGKNGHFSTVFL